MDEAEAAECFEAVDPEVLALRETVAMMEADNNRLLSLTSWGYRRAGNAYAKPPLVKPKTEALGP